MNLTSPQLKILQRASRNLPERPSSESALDEVKAEVLTSFQLYQDEKDKWGIETYGPLVKLIEPMKSVEELKALLNSQPSKSTEPQPDIEPVIQHEKTKVIFRKHPYGIIALFPEIPYDEYNSDSCVSYVYFDTPAFYREAARRIQGLPVTSFEKKEAAITYVLNNTTKAKPAEYNKLNKLLMSNGFNLEEKDEIDEVMDWNRNYIAFVDRITENTNKEYNENINANNVKKDNFWKVQKEAFWKTIFKGFIFIAIGLPFLLFLIAVTSQGGLFILGGIIYGVLALCYYVGKLFSSRK